MDWASSLRIVGDVVLSGAFPLLISRVLARGNAGISTTTQMLHLIAFMLQFPKFSSDQSACVKMYLVVASASVLVAIRYIQARQGYSVKQRLVATAKESGIYLLGALLLAYRINHASFSWSDSWSSREFKLGAILEYFSIEDLLNSNGHDAVEVAWAASVFLLGVAEIPQYIRYYCHATQRIDWHLMTIMAMIALSPMFHITSWITRFMDGHSFDYISFSGAVAQIFAFWMFFVLVISKVNDYGSDGVEDLEAQLAVYDAERWGGEASDPLLREDTDDNDDSIKPVWVPSLRI